MSRAFVKDDATLPLLVPARAPLPEGTRNYVTLRGLALLRSELATLLAELAASERLGEALRAESNALRSRISELQARIASAEPVDATQGNTEVVRFGARVTIQAEDGTKRRVRIVGVDEADAAEGRIAFVSPLARAMIGKRAGDVVILKTPRGEDEFEVIAIDFEAEADDS